ncbi:hypothetical protein Tsubulata_002817 [Turnera subulata]|uniref:Uncharacterized protein n=1 Tax=Turnera subulata TaxID=218843 RepID=A0A9Q0EYM1_9ROSI|nr:hypothetical protein Tsubulata_002817 [Turnera subulata]
MVGWISVWVAVDEMMDGVIGAEKKIGEAGRVVMVVVMVVEMVVGPGKVAERVVMVAGRVVMVVGMVTVMGFAGDVI